MNHHKDQTTTTINLSALIAQIMSSESSRGDIGGVTFQPPNIGTPNLQGTNVGATMIIHRSSGLSSGDVDDSCGVNIYVSNNIQGLNNSIMIGSRLYMGDPGVWLTLRDLKLDRWFFKRDGSNVGRLSLGVFLLTIFVIVFAFTVMYFM